MAGGGGTPGQKQQVIMYKAGWHMVPCLYAVESHLYKMIVNEVEIFSGDVDRNEGIKIRDKFTALGGLEKEGGVQGDFAFYAGGPTQGYNDYLVKVLGDVPAYRGVISIIAYRPYLQANNPYLFPWKFKLGCFHGDWYPETLKINGTRTEYTTTVTELETSIEDDPTEGSCTFIKYEQELCSIPGYPGPYTWETSAVVDDPDSWLCDPGSSPLYSAGVPICTDYTFVGGTTEDGERAQSQTITTTTSEEVTFLAGMNPVHIVRETLVNREWGRGLSEGLINDAEFVAAADTIYSEGLAISISWDKQSAVDEFLQVMMDHMGAALATTPGSGLYTIRLIRDGQPSELSIGEDNILVFDEYEEKGWAGTTNELTVKYVDIEDGKTKSVTVHDLAAIERQGDIIHETRDYPGIPSIELAQKIAERDLAAITSSGAKIVITTDRIAYGLIPGMNFDVTWSEYGLSQALFRAVDIDYGKQDQNEIRISAISDAPISTLFGRGSAIGSNPPTFQLTEPLNANPRAVYEATYWHLAQSRELNGFPTTISDYIGYLIAVGGKPQDTSTKFSTQFRKNSDLAESGSYGYWSGSLLTMFAINKTETFIFLDRTYNRSLEKITPGRLAILGKVEIIEIVAFDLASWTLQVNRGMLDTVPVEHSGPVILNTIDPADVAFSYNSYDAGDAVTAWLQTVTSAGTLALEDTSEVPYTVTGLRHGRPLLPGGVSVNGEYLGVVFTGPLTISWAGRNRLIQTLDDEHITQYDENVTPEEGTKYTLSIFGDEDTLLTSMDLEGNPTSYTYPTADEIEHTGTGKLNARLRFLLKTERGGLQSWDTWEHICYRAASQGPAHPLNNHFEDGTIDPWEIEYGEPYARPIAEMPFTGPPETSDSGYYLGNRADNLESPWSISQVLNIGDYTSSDGIAQGLTVFKIDLYHRAITQGSIGELRVDYFDFNGLYMSSEISPHFYFGVGAWGTVTTYASNPPGAYFAKIVVTSIDGATATYNDGYIAGVDIRVYGRLGESVYITAISLSATLPVDFDDRPVRTTALSASAVIPGEGFDDRPVRTTALSASAVIPGEGFDNRPVRTTALSISAVIKVP